MHRRRRGFPLRDGRRDRAHGRIPEPPCPVLPEGSGAKPRGTTRVSFTSGPAEVALFDRASLGAGDRIAGPAIVSQLDATTLVPGWTAEVHSSGAILLTTAGGPH